MTDVGTGIRFNTEDTETRSEMRGTGIAGVRLADGRQVFVEGVPQGLVLGDQMRIVLDGEERIGLVTIAPPQVIWRDPAARCAVYVRREQTPEAPAVSSAPPMDGLFLAEHAAPDASTLAAMLALAGAETERLDT